MVETGGHLSIEQVPAPVIKIVDVKCPGSGEVASRTTGRTSDRLAPHDEVKFVIKDRADYEFARDVVAQAPADRPRRRRAVLAGPRRAGRRASSRPGSSRTSSTSGCSCRRTSSSGAPTSAASRPRAVVLLSGGLDSYTAGAMAATRRLRAVRADGPLRPGPRARDRGGARASPPRSASRATSSSTSTSRRSAARRSSATATIPKDRDVAAGHDIPSTYVPARNTVFLSLALAWAEVVGADRDRHRRQRARLLRLSGLPPRVPRGVRAPGRAGDEGRRRRRAAPHPRAAAAPVEGRDHPRAGVELGLDYGLTHSCYDPLPDGTPVRPLRQLPAARQGLHRGRH